MLLYEAKLRVRCSEGLTDEQLAKAGDNIEEIVQGPLGDALVEAIIAALGDPDTFDVALS